MQRNKPGHMTRNKKSTLEFSQHSGCEESALIQLSARQMNEAINDAFAEIGVLSQLISAMKKQARKLKNNSQNLQEKEVCTEQLLELVGSAETIIKLAIQSQDRMQFADRMHHRLYDAQDSLKKAAKIVSGKKHANHSSIGSLFSFFSPTSTAQGEQKTTGRSRFLD